MGRARFLLCTGFINRAAMGRARFLLCTGFILFYFFLAARPWAERGSSSARGLLLTARPWAERGSCFTRCLFFFYFFFIFFFVGHQTQTSTRRTLNHAICNVYSRKLLKHKYTENVTDIGALIHGKCYGYCFL